MKVMRSDSGRCWIHSTRVTGRGSCAKWSDSTVSGMMMKIEVRRFCLHRLLPQVDCPMGQPHQDTDGRDRNE
jgi:hypothetical protein